MLITLGDTTIDRISISSSRAEGQNSLKTIVDMVTTSKILADTDPGSKIEFSVPKTGEDCTLTFNPIGAKVGIEIDYDGNATIDVQETRTMFFDSANFSYPTTPVKCGQTITIERT